MQGPHTFPALLGDGQGRYRVHFVGNSGELHNILIILVEALEPFSIANFTGSGKVSMSPLL